MSRRIHVYCGKRKRLVSVDLDDFDKTKEAIRQKWSLQGDFVLQAPDGDGEYTEIVDDDDLNEYRNAESLTVHLLDEPLGATAAPNVVPTLPPSYEQSIQPPTSTFPQEASETKSLPVIESLSGLSTDSIPSGHTQTAESVAPAMPTHSKEAVVDVANQVPPKVSEKKSLPVSYKERRRSVTVELDKIDDTIRTIRQRLMIDGDFLVKAKVGTDDYRDIIDESDLDDLRAASELVVEDLPDPSTDSIVSEHAQTTESVAPAHLKEVVARQDFYLQGEGEAALIKYEQTEYCLYQPPPSKSLVVYHQQLELRKTMNITKLVDNLELTADFLRLAYYGVLGDRELHKKIQEMQFDVAELSKLCGSAAVQFKIKAGNIIENLEYGFSYLLDGDNEFALENFKKIAVISKEVLEKTETLKGKVETKAEEIRHILALVTEEYNKGLTASSPEMLIAEGEKHLKLLVEKESKEISQTSDQCKELVDDITKSKSNMAETEKSKKPIGDNFFDWVNQGYVHTTDLKSMVADKEEMLEIMSKEGRLKELEEIKRAREKEQTANSELLKMVEIMKKFDIQREKEGMLDMAMRGAHTGIRGLLTALNRVITFWEKLIEQCSSIANTETPARLEMAANPEKKSEFWTRPPFKRQALNFFAKWVALHNMCQEFQDGMERVEDGIHLSIQENPSVEEARNRMKDLLAEFDGRVKKDQDALKKVGDQDELEKLKIKKEQKALTLE